MTLHLTYISSVRGWHVMSRRTIWAEGGTSQYIYTAIALYKQSTAVEREYRAVVNATFHLPLRKKVHSLCDCSALRARPELGPFGAMAPLLDTRTANGVAMHASRSEESETLRRRTTLHSGVPPFAV